MALSNVYIYIRESRNKETRKFNGRIIQILENPISYTGRIHKTLHHERFV